MPNAIRSNPEATIDDEYVARHPRSHDFFERQRRVVPGGFTHMSRVLTPFPLFIEAARGAHKWDADGIEYVDFWMGHGAMLLGHAHPDVVTAVAEQAARGFHVGGETPLAVEWAELVCELVPSAQAVRFMASGGEATTMAFRVARAFTGRSKILKFHGGFHGWHDAASIGVVPPYDTPMSIGIPTEVGETVVAVPFGNPAKVEEALERHPDIAGIVIEPGGPFTSTVPCRAEFLQALRELSSLHGALLIFDEVVTGFRYARGGAQEAFGVLPDLTTLGKIVGGGLPVGALAGKRDVMDVLAWKPDPNYVRFEMVPHPGTWNANPAVAAAGTATLRIVRDTDAIVQAESQSRKIIDGLNAVFEDEGIQAFAYGRGGMFKTCLGQVPGILSGDDSSLDADVEQLFGGWGPKGEVLRKAMICEGIDLMRKDGIVSSAHSDADVEQTCAAMARVLRRMKREEYLSDAHRN